MEYSPEQIAWWNSLSLDDKRMYNPDKSYSGDYYWGDIMGYGQQAVQQQPQPTYFNDNYVAPELQKYAQSQAQAQATHSAPEVPSFDYGFEMYNPMEDIGNWFNGLGGGMNLFYSPYVTVPYGDPYTSQSNLADIIDSLGLRNVYGPSTPQVPSSGRTMVPSSDYLNSMSNQPMGNIAYSRIVPL